MARTTIRSEDITAGQIKSADLETNVVISGDLTVDTDTLYIDSTNNRVGIGTSSPTKQLEVSGTDARIYLSGNDTDISMDGNGNGHLKLDGNGYAFGIALDASGANLYTNSSVRGLIFGTNETERMRIDNSGNLLVGTTTSGTVGTYDGFTAYTQGHIAVSATDTRSIFARRNSDGQVIIFRRDATTVGNISVTTSATSYNTSSDYRLKEDCQPMSGSIDRLKNLNPVNFAWKVDGSRVDGFLAHEAQEVVPEAITGTKDAVDADGNPEYQGIDQSKLVPLLTAALQEAVAKIESLEARVAVLEAN